MFYTMFCLYILNLNNIKLLICIIHPNRNRKVDGLSYQTVAGGFYVREHIFGK
jgi:hypothetical protein